MCIQSDSSSLLRRALSDQSHDYAHCNLEFFLVKLYPIKINSNNVFDCYFFLQLTAVKLQICYVNVTNTKQ